MAEIICQVCGRPNPAKAVTCAYCKATLKPSGGPETPSQVPDENTDWLNSLRSTPEPSSESSQPGEISGEEGNAPDWLSRIRLRSQFENQDDEGLKGLFPDSDGQDEALPDWMTGVNDPEPSAKPVERISSEEGGEDWLERIRKRAEAEKQDPEFAPEPDAGDETADFESWLHSFDKPGDTDQTPTKSEEAAVSPVNEEKPAWSVGVTRALSASHLPVTPPEDGETPDWLDSFKKNQTEIPAVSSPASETPDWLKAFAEEPPVETPAASQSAGDTPDWLKTFAEEIPTEAPVVSQPSGETPDWLKAFAEETIPETPAAPQAEGETPDWLKAFAEEAPAETPAAPQPAGETPDWLKAFGEVPESGQPIAESPGEVKAIEETTPEGSMAAVAGGDLTDWLKAFEESPTETPAMAGEQQFDWLSQLPLENVIQPEQEDLQSPEVPDEVSKFTASTETEKTSQVAVEPGWLSATDLEKDVPGVMASPAFKLGGLEEEAQAFEETSPFSPEDLLKWLPASGEQPGEGKQRLQEAPTQPESQEGLEQANLPGWLEAMRPVEAIVGEVESQGLDENKIEKSGPLAGLPGVLPSDNQVLHYRKPPVYSARLKISERQKEQVNILEGLVNEAGKPQPAQKENLEVPGLLMRLVLAVILIGAILLPILVTPPTTETPGLETPLGVLNFSNRIETILPNETVLLAVDYEPGYSGEMRFTAKGVIQRLLLKQTRLALVSTLPAGPVMGENLVSRAAGELSRISLFPATVPEGQMVNLGYLPAGLSSLQEFDLNPQQAAASIFGTSGTRAAWQHPALQGIGKVQDFAAVILLTDSVETARAWIEQVGPSLGKKPLLLVTSAQAAPLLRPYVESGQAGALLSGLADGMSFERLAKTPGSAAAYWISYRFGLYVAIGCVLVGFFFKAVLALFSKGKP